MGYTWKLGVKIAVILPFILVGIFASPSFAESYTASISTSGVVTVNATSNGNGTSVGVDNLSVISTCPSGYNVTIEGPSDTNLYLNGDSSNNASGSYIAHSNGTPSNPATITGANLGTWGYSTTSSTGSGNFIGLTNTATTLTSKNSASASGGDTIPVYYGVSVPTGLAPGTYKMPGISAITYYLTRSDNCVSYLVSFNANGGSGTAMATQRIYEDQTTALSTNSYTAPTGKVFKEWNTAADGSGTSYSDGESVTNIANIGVTLPLYAIWSEPCDRETSLYDLVACRSKGTQTASDLQTTITAPTSSNPLLDASTSGVYEYNSSAFGADSDPTKFNGDKAKIYYYRGILDNTTGSYGSNGDGEAYPNYVILSPGSTKSTTDTCWRIVRTTGSGGVKMIYNGKWTGSTCANSQTNAEVSKQYYNDSNVIYSQSILAIGYTYNSDYKTTSANTEYGTLFGTNTNYSGNSTDSTIKDYIENSWFNSIDDYENILEPNAGYCNDRMIYSSRSSTSPLTDSSSIKVPFATGGNEGNVYYFGPDYRVMKSKATLNCYRNKADLYTTASTDDGNNQLNKPVALLTLDEAIFAGNGKYSSNSLAYHSKAFLNTGSLFWLLSPAIRTSGRVNSYSISSAQPYYLVPSYSHGVRPVISLKAGTAPSSGAGTATNPWVIKSHPDSISCDGANKICYYPNSLNNDIKGTMGGQSASANTSIELLASNFSREGYGFAGWNTEPDYSGTFYGPQETITTPSNMSAGLSLYAVWVESEGSLQDTNKVSSICNRLTQSGPNVTRTLASVSALTDQRDNETYAIAKLADGNCWIIENMRLEAENTRSTEDINLSQGYGSSTTYGNFIGLANAQPASDFVVNNPPSSNSIYSTTGYTTVTIQGGDSSYYYARIPRYNNINTPTNASSRPSNPATNTATNITSGAGLYSYGNYYSWSAALANIIEYTNPTTQVENKTSETVNTSICPTGWRIPYGRNTGNGATSGSFSYLDIQLGGRGVSSISSSTPTGAVMSKAYRSFPNNFIYSGYINGTYGSSVDGRGSYGYYWTSTSYDNNYAYDFDLNDSTVWPGTFYLSSKYYGIPIRCIFLNT